MQSFRVMARAMSFANWPYSCSTPRRSIPIASNKLSRCSKRKLELRGRDLFYPLRLALAGRPGEGELDRVILLLDEAASLPFAIPVKSTRTRIVQFCSALD